MDDILRKTFFLKNYVQAVNQLQPGAAFLYPLKTFSGYRKATPGCNGLKVKQPSIEKVSKIDKKEIPKIYKKVEQRATFVVS